MKKITVFAMVALLSFTTFTAPLLAGPAKEAVATTTTNPAHQAEADKLVSRLNEIDALDKSSMKSAEKKALRKEVRSIKQRLGDLGSGVYVSVGAIIIILLLLIILL
jgi:hypothetical protein